eukprot:scaffold5479_cov199-Amphora_coffeaeformis.AAC.80
MVLDDVRQLTSFVVVFLPPLGFLAWPSVLGFADGQVVKDPFLAISPLLSTTPNRDRPKAKLVETEPKRQAGSYISPLDFTMRLLLPSVVSCCVENVVVLTMSDKDDSMESGFVNLCVGTRIDNGSFFGRVIL